MTWTVRSGADLGRAIADIRDLRRLTQEELAREMVIGRSYLSKIEAGRSVSLLEHMLRAFRRLGAQVTVTYDHLPDGATESA
jgi:transcriptional regulator with XRE-family HTH domain